MKMKTEVALHVCVSVFVCMCVFARDFMHVSWRYLVLRDITVAAQYLYGSISDLLRHGRAVQLNA